MPDIESHAIAFLGLLWPWLGPLLVGLLSGRLLFSEPPFVSDHFLKGIDQNRNEKDFERVGPL
jgi:hypothetical protein